MSPINVIACPWAPLDAASDECPVPGLAHSQRCDGCPLKPYHERLGYSAPAPDAHRRKGRVRLS